VWQCICTHEDAIHEKREKALREQREDWNTETCTKKIPTHPATLKICEKDEEKEEETLWSIKSILYSLIPALHAKRQSTTKHETGRKSTRTRKKRKERRTNPQGHQDPSKATKITTRTASTSHISICIPMKRKKENEGRKSTCTKKQNRQRESPKWKNLYLWRT